MLDIKSKLIALFTAAIVIMFFGLNSANALVEPGWPSGTPNVCQNPTDGFMNFELGIEEAQIESSIPGVEFTTTYGLNWRYGDIRTGNYNVNPYGTTIYETNGNFFAWLGITGDRGRITFTGGTASYLSVLVSTYSGVTLDAYDADGVLLANSGWAGNNTSTGTLTRLTVEAEGMAYVEVHDTGNYWLIDDLCTDAPPPCQPVPGYTLGDQSDRIDIVFVPDEDYAGNMTNFLNDVTHKIDDRLGFHAPINGNLDMFNFYYTELEGDVSGYPSGNCGQESSLPDNFLTLCPFADAVVVLHTTSFTDCSRSSGGVGVFSGEGPTDRSFIHEAGHGVFGLKDEYDSDREQGSCAYTAYNTSRPIPSNIWETEADCRDDCTDRGWDPDQCYEFTPCQGDWWKLGDPALTTNDDKYYDEDYQYIMKDGYDFAKGWGDASAFRIDWIFDNYPFTPEPPLPPPSGERCIILELNINDSAITLIKKKFVASQPPQFIPVYDGLTAKMYHPSGNMQAEFGFADPRSACAGAELGGTGSSTLESVDFTLILPYFNHLGMAQIVDTTGALPMLTVDLTDFATTTVNNTPTCDADGPYTEDCGGTTTTVALDGSGSIDIDGDPLTYAWDTDCPGGSFDDPTCATPTLTVDSSNGCNITCSVSLTVTDDSGASDTDTATVTIQDIMGPDITCPSDLTIECDESNDPSNTGMATATDDCDLNPTIDYSDMVTPGDCPSEETITRTWTATDYCGNTSSCVQTIEVVDSTPPVIECNNPDTIKPPDVPISFTATATDNCDDTPVVEITEFDCFLIVYPIEKRIDKTGSCEVSITNDTITILDSGGVDTHITWTSRATDSCGNVSEKTCETLVVNPGVGLE